MATNVTDHAEELLRHADYPSVIDCIDSLLAPSDSSKPPQPTQQQAQRVQKKRSFLFSSASNTPSSKSSPAIPSRGHNNTLTLSKQDLARALAIKAEALLMLDKYEAAIVCCNNALVSDTTNGVNFVLRTKSRALLKSKMLDNAMEAVDQAMIFSPGDPDDFTCR